MLDCICHSKRRCRARAVCKARPCLSVALVVFINHANAGNFNPATGGYEFSLYPSSPGVYHTVLTLRHPSVPTSPRSIIMQMQAVRNPAAGVSAIMGAPASDTSAVLNPLTMPRVTFTAQFPGMSADGYGGVTRALADYTAMLVATCGLAGPSWVVASSIQSSPLTFDTTVSQPQPQTRHACASQESAPHACLIAAATIADMLLADAPVDSAHC